MTRLTTLADVTHLPKNIHPSAVERLVGDDHETFTLVVVAEATRRQCPYGVTAWLTQPNVVPDWVEALCTHIGTHQIAWWTKTTRHGPHDPSTITARTALTALRDRFQHAYRLLSQDTSANRFADRRAQGRAVKRLQEAHADEYARLVARYQEQPAQQGQEEQDAVTLRLVGLQDDAFRRLVVRDVQNRIKLHQLAHPAVSKRWRDALRELGNDTRELLGLPALGTSAPPTRFPPQDEELPAAVTAEEADQWIRRTRFLHHVQVRLLECARHNRTFNQLLSQKVYEPAEDALRDAHYPEYSRYLLEERAKDEAVQAAQPANNRPAAFTTYAQALEAAGWTVRHAHTDRRCWVDARRGAHRLTVTTERKPGQKGSWSARHMCFAWDPESGNWWRVLQGFSALQTLAETPEGAFQQALAQAIEASSTERRAWVTVAAPEGEP